jgi:hypothetical protein
MSKEKKYPRITMGNGKILLQLLDADTFKTLYDHYPECYLESDHAAIVTHLQRHTATPDAENTFRNAIETAREWMQIESGLPVLIIKTKTGVIFALPETRDAVNKYRWLHSKALKYASRIMVHVRRTFGEVI